MNNIVSRRLILVCLFAFSITEQQLNTANNIETTEHALEKSMRILRGMTWSGMFYNMTTPESKPLPTIASKHQRDIYSSNPNMLKYKTERNELFEGTTQKSVDPHEDELLKLSGTLNHLENISLEINKSLVTQNELTTELEDKTNQVNDIALATILRSAQLTQRAKKSLEMYLGDYSLFDEGTSQYLSVHGTSLILSTLFDRSSLFRVYVKESHLIGIQSHLTLRYLGINMFGTVCVSSTHFGSYEETFLDLDNCRGSQGILFLASNWGGGGWLQYGDPIDPNTPSKGVFCTSVTKSISDTTKKVQLKAILVPPDCVDSNENAESKSSIWSLLR